MRSSCMLISPAAISRNRAVFGSTSPSASLSGSTALRSSRSSCRSGPSRCDPGMTCMAPFSRSLSAKASQTVTDFCGRSGQ